MTIAYFDLDRTLISRNSGSLWIRSELRLGFLSRWQFLQATGWLVRYQLGLSDLTSAIREAVSTLDGTREEALRSRTLAFYEREVRGLVRPGAREALTAHRSAGDTLALLTTSSNYLSEPVCAELEIDAFLCNRFEVHDGVFNGVPQDPLCYGAGKVELAAAFAAERGVELSSCVFYSDSYSDLPMLEAVGTPVVVNPDPRLRRHARRQGWTAVDWGEPS